MFCFCCSFQQILIEALKHLVSTHHILFDFGTQTQQCRALSFSNQSNDDSHHLLANDAPTKLAYLWKLPVQHLQKIQKWQVGLNLITRAKDRTLMDQSLIKEWVWRWIWLKKNPFDFIQTLKNKENNFHKSLYETRPTSKSVKEKETKTKVNENSLFFFFVMVPATCLLFILSITWNKKRF